MKIGRQAAIYNKTMTLADTEYSQQIGPGVVKVLVQCRGTYDVKIAFKTGESGTNYLTLKAGSVYYEDAVDDAPMTLYFQCAQAGQVLEIIGWIR